MDLVGGEIRRLITEFGELAHEFGSAGEGRSVELADRSNSDDLVGVFRNALDIAFEELGPQHLFGGCGPWYRWQTSDALIQLEYSSWSVRMSLLHKEETERAEYLACEWGDRDHVTAEVGVWVAEFDRGGMWGGYSPGGKLAPDWNTFEEWVTDTLCTLESDLAILEMGLSVLMTPVRFDARKIQISIEPGRIEAIASQPHHMDRQVFRSLGWQAADDDTWFVIHQTPTRQNIQALATLIAATFRAYGLELDRIKYTTSCPHSGWINLLGLGLGHL